MKKITEDQDLREEVRKKCLNDWNLDLNEDQISSCLVKMEKTKLSIFHGQIWPNTRNVKVGKKSWEKKITWAISIDGYRAIAHRNGLAGIDEPSFITDDEGTPIQASIKVYRLNDGIKSTYVGVARYREFVQMVDEYDGDTKTGGQIPSSQWKKAPFNQLAMAAERQALRRGFQETLFDEDLGEVYDPAPPEIEDTPPAQGEPDVDSEPVHSSHGAEEGDRHAPALRQKRPPAAKPDLNPSTEAATTPSESPEIENIKKELRPLLEWIRNDRYPDHKINQKFIKILYKELVGVVIGKGRDLDITDLTVLLDTLRDEKRSKKKATA